MASDGSKWFANNYFADGYWNANYWYDTASAATSTGQNTTPSVVPMILYTRMFA